MAAAFAVALLQTPSVRFSLPTATGVVAVPLQRQGSWPPAHRGFDHGAKAVLNVSTALTRDHLVPAADRHQFQAS